MFTFTSVRLSAAVIFISSRAVSYSFNEMFLVSPAVIVLMVRFMSTGFSSDGTTGEGMVWLCTVKLYVFEMVVCGALSVAVM